MTRLALPRRLARLEAAVACDVPLYLRRWLGETLTVDEQAQADAEWQRVQASPSPVLSRLSASARTWLAERGDLA